MAYMQNENIILILAIFILHSQTTNAKKQHRKNTNIKKSNNPKMKMLSVKR